MRTRWHVLLTVAIIVGAATLFLLPAAILAEDYPPATISVTSPNGGESLIQGEMGQDVSVTWGMAVPEAGHFDVFAVAADTIAGTSGG